MTRPEAHVVRPRDLTELAGTSPFVAVLVDDADTGDVGRYLADIAQNHTRLPYRLMIATARKSQWQEALADNAHIPKRRLYLIDRKDADTEDVLALYSTWIRTHRPPPVQCTAWLLVIGLERPLEAVRTAWTGLAKLEWDDLVQVAVVCKEAGGLFEPAAKSPNFKPLLRLGMRPTVVSETLEPHLHTMLILDNHGRAVDLANKSGAAFYVPFGLTADSGIATSITFSQQVESPPQGDFAFKFFVLSLLEAALTRIAVLDERLVAAFVHQKEVFAALVHAGILPIIFLADGTGSKARKQFALGRSDAGLPEEYPGLRYGQHGWDLDWPQASQERFRDLDVMVVHEGLITGRAREMWRGSGQEHAREQAGIQSREETLFRLCPRVVVTSGSGGIRLRKERSVPPPFLEFSVLSGFTYEGLDKLALTRAVLAATTAEARET